MTEKILIIPDVHTNWELVESIVRSHPDATNIVSLGDWFDNWNDTYRENYETADYVKFKLNDPKWTFLWGNHDISYAFTSPVSVCSGYTQEKAISIKEVLKGRDWDKFKFHHWIGDTLLTHAGLHNSYVPSDGKIMEMLLVEEDRAQENLRRGIEHWFYGAGRARGGPRPFGGILWCDANQEFIPVKGLNQIFGHTCQYDTKRPLVLKDPESPALNICLDSALRHYGVIEDRVFRLESSFK
jgi:hypothetical protein